jgi:hypothetical protein
MVTAQNELSVLILIESPKGFLVIPKFCLLFLVLNVSAVLVAQEQLTYQYPDPIKKEDALATMRVPEGFRVELVAAEPLVLDPVGFDWGPDGKLWVIEMADYPLGLDGKGQPAHRSHQCQGDSQVAHDTPHDRRLHRRLLRRVR